MSTVALSAKTAAARFMPPLSLRIQSALMANEIDALLQENRTFPPHDEFRRHANAKDESVYDVKDREAYWADWAAQLDWQTKWNKGLDWNPPYAKWFFGGFSAEALRDRIIDAEAKVLITATSGYRRGNIVPLKKLADSAVTECPSITNVVVVMRRAAADEAEDTLTMH